MSLQAPSIVDDSQTDKQQQPRSRNSRRLSGLFARVSSAFDYEHVQESGETAEIIDPIHRTWNCVPELTEQDQVELSHVLQKQQRNIELKIGVYGETNVGKTAFIQKMTTHQFSDVRRPQATSSQCKKRVDGRDFLLQFVDCEVDFLTSILQTDMVDEMQAFVFIFDSESSMTKQLIDHVNTIHNSVTTKVHQQTECRARLIERKVKWKDLPILVLFNIKSEFPPSIESMQRLVESQFRFPVPFIPVNVRTGHHMDIVATQLVRIAASKTLHLTSKYSQDKKCSLM